jgi:uncharacterized protein YeeX (DUF496 family)
MIVSPKENLLSLSDQSEVKKVSVAMANDALDLICDYLIQNGRIGAAKLPAVKELRDFLLIRK